jgi:hypothetical protein
MTKIPTIPFRRFPKTESLVVAIKRKKNVNTNSKI